MASTSCYIDFAAGKQDAHDDAVRRYESLVSWLETNGPKYGLASRLEDLDEAAQETLTAVYSGDAQVRSGYDSYSCRNLANVIAVQTELSASDLRPPPSLLLPRLRFTVSSSPGLKKTTSNFLALLTDEKKLFSKRAPNPPLRYASTPVFRIEKGFVAQTGDVTRRDGSGGESICTLSRWPLLGSESPTLPLAHRWRCFQRREGRLEGCVSKGHARDGKFGQEL